MTLPTRLLWTALESFPLSQITRAFDLASKNRLGIRGMLAQAFEFAHINDVPGDYFEFGVWRGDTFSLAHRFKRQLRPKMRMWAFDSFEGLPEIDEANYNVWEKGQYSCSEEDFRRVMNRRGVRDDEFETVRGYYEDSLNAGLHERMLGVKAAVVYVDCDLYTSTKQVLEFLPPYFVDGTVICFDDYYNYRGSPNHGEQRAIREFLASHAHVQFTPYLDYAPLGKAFLVHLQPADGRQPDEGPRSPAA